MHQEAVAAGDYRPAESPPIAQVMSRRRLWYFLAAVVFLVVTGIPTLVIPLSSDEAVYALGARTVLRGGQLYRDFWDIKPPLIYLSYAVPVAVDAAQVESYRVFHLFVIGFGMAGVFFVTARYFSDRAALIAACFYCFAYFGVAWLGNQGEAESFMAGPLLLALAVYKTAEKGSYPSAFLAGMLLGIGCAFKLSSVLFVLGLPLAELLFKQEGWTPSGAIKRLAFAGAAFLLVQAVWIGYLNAAGVWSAYVDIQRNYTIPYNQFRWLEGTTLVRSILDPTGDWFNKNAYLVAPAWAAVFISFFRGNRPAVSLLTFLSVIAIITVWWQGKYFDYQWLIMLPFLAPLAGFSVDQALDLVRALPRRDAAVAKAVLAAGLMILAIWPLYRVYEHYGVLLQRLSGNFTRADVEQHYLGEFGANRQIVEHIRENSSADDGFLVFGFWPQPYIWEERPLPSRFVTSASVRSTWSPAKWRRELIADLIVNKPRFIAVAAGDHQPWLTGSGHASDQYLCDAWPELRQLIEENYRAVINNGLFVLYDREAREHLALPRCVA